ncbi:MAG: hypothetical protein FWG92_02305 [Leptospirales bacterium]|nr:hypothetical protein [Leptospirales bacterium]
MNITKKYLPCLLLLLFAGAYAAAQDADLPDISDAPQNVIVEDIPVENIPAEKVQAPTPQKKAPAPQKQAVRNRAQPAQPKPEPPKQQDENRMQSLLPVTEGNFKYSRIPGITLPQTPSMGDISYVPEEPKNEIVNTAEDEKSLFPFKINNDLMKVLILLLILAIFIFYRVNSKKRRRRKYFKY